ncbi:amino acid adenylation domain-containing protein [Dactylosporangium fulvum]|uniref:Amino acid adenylation domain-containing protein n=1 Tax=Dactylosporangium fulvum TaxID=53359 RepID=A0ABY5VS52_9ACTN|nr:amino acid adenylation domain-containing protein [Dactylosporangium fulvum]UWP80115.1 amino acid adenylation domain-containing protein [Dactylosporangium fulvum]
MPDLKQRVAELSEERRALFAALTKTKDTTRIPRVPRDRPIPASFAQQRLWFVDHMEPGNTAYNCPIPVRLRGPLEVDALIESLADVVRRHEVLRTTFRGEHGQPVQVIHPEMPLPCPLTDLSDLPPQERDAAVRRAVAEDAEQPFDLANGPVMRARLLRFGPEEHVLLYDLHHIAFDVWSVGVVHAELAAGYNARVRGTEAELPELPIQYADYAAWQRERISGPLLDEQLAYWRRQLDGLESLDLPTDHDRPDSLSYRGGWRQLDLPQRLVAGLRELGRAEGASLFMTMLAAVQVLLARYTDTDDVAVGIAAAERDRPEVQGLIGFFPNTLVLRGDLSGQPTFRDFLRRIRTTARDAFAHAELPFDLLVQDLRPTRSATRTPLFPVFFGVEDGTTPMPAFDGLDAEIVFPDHQTAKFDLGFNVRVGAEHTVVDAVFSADLFEPATIDRMLRHYRQLLEAAVAAPDRPITVLPMLTDAEWRDIRAWNDTGRVFPDHACLHHLVEEQTARGDAPAVRCGSRTLSRPDLEAAANRLARRLRDSGVGPDTVVGVCLPRSPELVVAILAVLKSGGAYLPLDPDYPPQRLRFMLTDAGCPVVVTRQDLRDGLGAVDGTVLGVDDDVRDVADTRPDVDVRPDHLAYVIYTSGSTGEPKGIALQHRGAVNNFTDFNDRFGIGPGDSVMSVSSPSFDMSVYDILGTLAAGATVVLPEPGEARDPAAWARLLAEHGVTVWHSAPALLQLLLEYLERDAANVDRHRLDRLRLALLGGDWIPVEQPERLWRVAPQARFVSLGGATEASMDSTIFPVERVDPAWTSIPYGRPMANQRTYVLDRHLQPVPVGVPGELHLAGTGLARGYLHRPELTAERFVEHTFADGHTERLYKTGDLVRYRPDGVLELLGRLDFQVKIHGLRIELGEIEAVLRRHPAVATAAVVAQGARGETRLAAFVTTAGNRPATEAELRQWLADALPAHMVPGSVTTLEALPTTPNGKVDRRALTATQPARDTAPEAAPEPVPATAPATVDSAAEAGTTGAATASGGGTDALERRIAAAWCDVLGVDEVGPDDDFFHLGGDSFTAIRAMLALDEQLPVVELFKNPTVRQLAARLAASAAPQTGMLLRLTPADREPELTLVCVPYGGGNVVAYQPLADRIDARFAVWAVNLPGHDPSTLRDEPLSVEEAAQRCAGEVQERISGPVLVYGQCSGVALGVELARVLEERGADIRGVYVGASLTDPDPAGSLEVERSTSDGDAYAFLRSLGGFDGHLEWSEVAHILRAARNDMIASARFFQRRYERPPKRLTVPLRCIFGDEDPATPDFPTSHHGWDLFADTVTYEVIPGAGHYFVRDRAEDVATLIERHHLGGER